MTERAGRCTGVSIHGYALHSPNFDEVILGIPPDRPGRLTKGLATFLENEAQFLAIGTGATKRDSDDKLEAEVIAEYLLDPDQIRRLWEFTCLDPFPIQRGLLGRIRGAIKLATRCKNTQEEIEEIGEIFEGLGVNHWIAVSSSDHISRLARNIASLSAIKGDKPPWNNIEVAFSPVPYGMGPDRVVILEVPNGAKQAYVDFLAEVGQVANALRTGDSVTARELLDGFLERARE